MRANTFGERRNLAIHRRNDVFNSGGSNFCTMDYVGMLILLILSVLVSAILYFGGGSADRLIEVICRALELPAGFASDWVLRSSLDIPYGVSLTAPLEYFVWLPIRSLLVAAHQAALVIGLGATLFLDLYLVRFLSRRTVSDQTLELVKFGSHIVAVGLFSIWLTGGAILAYYYFWEPTLLNNPKIWGKLIIVLSLTLNGMFLHNYALPNLRFSLGRSILDGSFLQLATTYLPLVAISGVSWGAAFILGAFKEINNTISTSEIIYAYVMAGAAIYMGIVLTCWALVSRRRSQI